MNNRLILFILIIFSVSCGSNNKQVDVDDPINWENVKLNYADFSWDGIQDGMDDVLFPQEGLITFNTRRKDTTFVIISACVPDPRLNYGDDFWISFVYPLATDPMPAGELSFPANIDNAKFWMARMTSRFAEDVLVGPVSKNKAKASIEGGMTLTNEYDANGNRILSGNIDIKIQTGENETYRFAFSSLSIEAFRPAYVF